jgi:hypothetical protein
MLALFLLLGPPPSTSATVHTHTLAKLTEQQVQPPQDGSPGFAEYRLVDAVRIKPR